MLDPVQLCNYINFCLKHLFIINIYFFIKSVVLILQHEELRKTADVKVKMAGFGSSTF